MRQEQRNPGFFVRVLVAVVLVSGFANVAEGFYTRYGMELTVANVSGIDPIQAFVGFTATGLLSLVVFALAEIVGQHIGTGQAVPQVTEVPMGTDPVDAMLTHYRNNPDATQAEVGEIIGKSRQWVSDQPGKLEKAGAISRNGRGVEVKEHATV